METSLDKLFDLADGLADDLGRVLGTPGRWRWMLGPLTAPQAGALVDPRRLVAHAVGSNGVLCPGGPPVDHLRPVDHSDTWSTVPAAIVCTACLAAVEVAQ